MKCPHCHKDFTPRVPHTSLWELKYMIGKGWLFRGTLERDAWRTDKDLVQWLERGWIEMHPELGFRITKEGADACQNITPTAK